jgi:hypothetical protein
MQRFLTTAIFASTLAAFAFVLALAAAPGARAASVPGPAKAVIIDVVRDMSAVWQVRGGSNRYKDQIRRHLHQGRRGDARALRQLGFHYAKGWGVIRDPVKAYMWFTLAGGLGNRDALENRASMTAGLGAGQIARAEEMAARWLESHDWDIDPGSFGGG